MVVPALIGIVAEGFGIGALDLDLGVGGWRAARVAVPVHPIRVLALRLLRKPEPPDLPARMVAARARAVDTLHERWLIATWATTLTAAPAVE